ncbi:hypothetical protein [Streptomyces sp. TRM68416]|uniref:hypothetical protein n=1 Tax=Streptomyces sp. TRM68416 TaxID=2758412 RepID=UPI001661A32F|nr:hypothetical protein [Streptomyces sp. TRM68416]MBD0844742.1 hypothetical protein [Streptomyces sp. TRM68416]
MIQLTARARNRQDQQEEIGALRVQADALTVAVAELRGAAAANRLLWDGPAERARSFLLATLGFFGGAALARIAGGSDHLSAQVGMGQAADLLSRDRRASKQNAAAAAAAPLMRSTDAAVAATTEQLLNACGDVENTERLEAALEAFGQAVRAATAPRLSWWARRRATRTT